MSALDVTDIPDELHDQFYDLENDSPMLDAFQEMALSQLVSQNYAQILPTFHQIHKLAFQILFPFTIPYLCKKDFSTLVHFKMNLKLNTVEFG